MASQVPGTGLRLVELGTHVLKSAQVPPNSGSSATLFTVTGLIRVTSLVGKVSTALSGSTGAVALGFKPTVGTEASTSISLASGAGVVGGAEVGTLIVPIFAPTTGLGTAPVATSLHAGVAAMATVPFMVGIAGVIEITTSVATMTGAIDWHLNYVPIEDGASVS